MTTYLVTETATGAEVYRYQSDTPIEWNGMGFATHTHTALPDETVPVEINPRDWHITRLAFRERFTQAEKIAIEFASLDYPAAPMEQRAMAAILSAAQTTPIWADARKMNGAVVQGTGAAGDLWRGA